MSINKGRGDLKKNSSRKSKMALTDQEKEKITAASVIISSQIL